ncbi:hypothetical protein BT69DRAFT_1366621 [Atractiella rhizophila]|nr:hypothetical protein BT69DRAFT_1366621 [Atractiella rhizophila]
MLPPSTGLSRHTQRGDVSRTPSSQPSVPPQSQKPFSELSEQDWLKIQQADEHAFSFSDFDYGGETPPTIPLNNDSGGMRKKKAAGAQSDVALEHRPCGDNGRDEDIEELPPAEKD